MKKTCLIKCLVPLTFFFLFEPPSAGSTAYPVRMKEKHFAEVMENPFVAPVPSADEDFVIGRSRGWDDPAIPPYNLYGYVITCPEYDGPKTKVVLTDGNHYEVQGSWSFHGMIDFLLGDDPRADELRRNAEFYVYPLVNPDGRKMSDTHSVRTLFGTSMRVASPEVAASGWQNHNRVWNTAGLFATIDALAPAMRFDTAGYAEYLFDFHSNGTTTYSPGFLFDSAYLRAFSEVEPEIGPSRFEIQGTTQMWSMRDDALGAPHAFTLEHCGRFDRARYMEIGRSYAIALHKVLTRNDFSGGSGRKDDPYIIENIFQLQEIRHHLNRHFALGADIDASDTGTWNRKNNYSGLEIGKAGAGTSFRLPHRPVTADSFALYVAGKKQTAGFKADFDRGIIKFENTPSAVYGLPREAENAPVSVDYTTVNDHFRGFEPIMGFMGSLDGRGRVVSGLYINRPDEHYVGVFGSTTSGSKIRNMGLSDVSITGMGRVGALAGNSYSVIEGVFATGELSGEYRVGGLTGVNFTGVIENSYSSVAVRGPGTQKGGIAGLQYRSVLRNSYAAGPVEGDASTGGLMGAANVGEGFEASNSFWDIEATGLIASAGARAGVMVEGRPSRELFAALTFKDAGWDISREEDYSGETWKIRKGEGYPWLAWEDETEDFFAPGWETGGSRPLSSPAKPESGTDPESLLDAAARGDTASLATFLEEGSEIDERNYSGNSPLHLAVERCLYPGVLRPMGGFPETVRFLLEHGAEVNAANARGWTPLHYAARYGSLDTTLLLIGSGADVNALNSCGDTPLHLASAYGYLGITEALLAAGADRDLAGKMGLTPLDWASRMGYCELEGCLSE